MMRSSVWISFLLMLASSRALAQAPLTPRQLEADKRYEEGVELTKSWQFAEARTKFEEACAAERTAKCLKNLGIVEMELKMYAEATEHFDAYLRDPASKTDPKRPRIQKDFEEVYAKSGHVEIVAPPGAEIRIDERAIGRAPLAGIAHVRTGEHTLSATSVGGQTVTTKVEAVGGEVRRVVLEFPEPTVAWPPPMHSIVLGAVAVAALGAGIGFALDVGTKNDRLNEMPSFTCANPTDCGALHDLTNARDRSRTLSTTFFVVSLAAGIAASGTWALFPRRISNEREAGLRLAPALGPGTAGLHFTGTF